MSAPFPFDAWARPGRDAFEFWISFFPTAPLFGVEWRFAEVARPAIAPFMQAGAVPFPVPFPATRAAAAAARPGELDTPAQADEVATDPVAWTAEAVGEIAEDAGRIATGTGRAVLRLAEAAVKADDVPEPAADAAPDETEVAGTADDPSVNLLEGADLGAGIDALAEDKAEARLTTRTTAETAVDEVPHDEARLDLIDAAIAAAPRPPVLLDQRPDDADDLKVLRGIGAGLEKQLNALGVWRFEQIARMTDADLAWIDANLTTFKGRCYRDDWVGQAKARLAR